MSNINYNVHPEPLGKWELETNTTAMVSFLRYIDDGVRQTISIDTLDLEDLLSMLESMKSK